MKVGALAALLESAGEAEARIEWAVVHSKVRVPVPVSYIHIEENYQFMSARRNGYIVHNCYADTDQNYHWIRIIQIQCKLYSEDIKLSVFMGTIIQYS